ncbi:hypothetical protein BU25DRAFT_428767 [Macroventuria anomochaeta]|uniref:Uncharacterized protein n=1 Tax=Macroventuria anomochaeta TaxID=301207 RepID=A0ACB6S9N6_9PLEO|nr:uncharacterized protein BU25DRAFT_428767 [Macroventuria anomochaeta]KAF2631011.1 hypothetical protein BU25DRAFT_428767 [Macroventuria anomochaeta]
MAQIYLLYLLHTFGPHSAYSSRDASPGLRAEPCDPFHDPIELSYWSRPSLDAQNSRSSHEQPLKDERRRRSHESSRSRAYLLPIQSNTQYVPISGRQESPPPSVRSERESMFSMNSLYQTKIMDAGTQALVDKRVGELAQWHIHWTTSAIIASLFVAGVIGAVKHHFFYAHLNGKPATEQLMMTTHMAHPSKEGYDYHGIDGLLSATEDPTMFFLNWKMVRHGKLATLMAICTTCRLIPIASILSPASLTPQRRPTIMTMICPAVATLNLTREAVFDFREEQHSNSLGNSLIYYNKTDPSGLRDRYFDYYDQPSKIAPGLAFSSAAQFCGTGWNRTYMINFMALGYKCDDVSDAVPNDAPFTIDQIAPQGNFIYHAEVDEDDYKRPQTSTTEGVPDPGYPESLGVIEDEPKTRHTLKNWIWVHEPKMFKCVMHHTNYTFEMRYRPAQNATLKQRYFLYPVINTTLTSAPNNDSPFIATLPSAFTNPRTNTTAYKLAAAYHSMGTMLHTFLRGDIEKTFDTFIITRSDIPETRLMDGRTSYPQSNLMDAVQDLFEDMLLTLLSKLTLVAAEMVPVECVKSRTMIVYIYLPSSLWIGYAIAAIYKNAVASDTLFSRILVTTRNPMLDHISVGACLGGDPFPRELRETKLRFDRLNCCFGTRGETGDIFERHSFTGLRRARSEVGSKEKKGLH